MDVTVLHLRPFALILGHAFSRAFVNLVSWRRCSAHCLMRLRGISRPGSLFFGLMAYAVVVHLPPLTMPGLLASLPL
eukprot:1052881-Karenia_brevis.AAC.1